MSPQEWLDGFIGITWRIWLIIKGKHGVGVGMLEHLEDYGDPDSGGGGGGGW